MSSFCPFWTFKTFIPPKCTLEYRYISSVYKLWENEPWWLGIPYRISWPLCVLLCILCLLGYWYSASEELPGKKKPNRIKQHTETDETDVECVCVWKLYGHFWLNMLSEIRLHSSVFHSLTYSLLAKSLWHCVILYADGYIFVLKCWGKR